MNRQNSLDDKEPNVSDVELKAKIIIENAKSEADKIMKKGEKNAAKSAEFLAGLITKSLKE